MKVHIRTVQTWHKRGLTVVDGQSRPYLVRGKDLLSFLIERQKRRRCKLGGGEIYCLACKKARLPHQGTVTVKLTGRTLGNGEQQLAIRSICPICGKKMVKLGVASSTRKLEE